MHANQAAAYRVLVVDDNAGIHEDFRALLQTKQRSDELDALASELFDDDPAPAVPQLPGYRLDSAFQGSMAVQSVKSALQEGQTYALAFVDIRMPPGQDGVQTIQQIWEIDPNIQVIICSAYSDYSWEDIVDALGVTDNLLVLRKPFDPGAVKQMALATTTRWSRMRAERQRIERLERRLAECEEHLRALQSAAVTIEAARESMRESLRALVSALAAMTTATPSEQPQLLQRAIDVSDALEQALA